MMGICSSIPVTILRPRSTKQLAFCCVFGLGTQLQDQIGQFGQGIQVYFNSYLFTVWYPKRHLL